MCQPAGWIFEKNIKNIKIFFAGGDELPRKPEEITIFRRSVMYGGNTRNPVKSSQRGFYRAETGSKVKDAQFFGVLCLQIVSDMP